MSTISERAAAFQSEQGERLAVVEDQLKTIRSDVSELKGDVKSLLLFQAAQASADRKGSRTWDNIFKVLPIIFSVISLATALIGLIVVAELSSRGI